MVVFTQSLKPLSLLRSFEFNSDNSRFKAKISEVKFFDHYSCIMSAEAEGIGNRSADGAVLGFVEREIDTRIYLGVDVEVIDGRWSDVVLDCQYGGDRLYRARCAPLPAGDYRVTLEVLVKVRPIQEADWADGADI